MSRKAETRRAHAEGRGTSLAQMGTVRFDRPLPIAVAIPSFQPGGTERQMIELVRRLDPRRWEAHLVSFRREGAWIDRAVACAASVATFPIRGFARPDTVTQMRSFSRWCRQHQIALVHTSDLYSNIFFLPAAALAGVPVRVASRREIAAGKSRTQIAMQRASYAFAHRIVANADAVAARLRRERVAPGLISTVPNGLDLTAFVAHTLRSPLRRVSMVGNLRPGKGHDTLINAAPSILQRYPDTRFELIGDGPERGALEKLARSRGVASGFTFTGHVEDVPRHLAESDVFTLPSESEAFPNALLEAMAAGLPVVATAVGGICEVVQHQRTGLLVPPRDPAKLADALCSLIADPERAKELALNGRAVVESRYSFERMVASIDQLYTDELMRRAPDRAVQSQYASL